jgi:DNA-binding MarR family transcriptional regulator
MTKPLHQGSPRQGRKTAPGYKNSGAAEVRPDSDVCNCTVLRKAARRVSILYDRALGPSGLRITQYAILAELGRSSPMTITELANAMVMDRNGLGHNLRPLEREGLVKTEIGRDRRSRVIVMTKTGMARLAAAKKLWRQGQERFGVVLGAKRVRALLPLLIATAGADYGDLATAR